MSKKSEVICAICKRDIREIGAFPIYSNKHDDTICSHCCFLGAMFHLGTISKQQLEPIPAKIQEEIMNLYENENLEVLT